MEGKIWKEAVVFYNAPQPNSNTAPAIKVSVKTKGEKEVSFTVGFVQFQREGRKVFKMRSHFSHKDGALYPKLIMVALLHVNDYHIDVLLKEDFKWVEL